MHTKRFNAFWVQFRLGVIPRLPLFSASNISQFLSVGYKTEKFSTNRYQSIYFTFILYLYLLYIFHIIYIFLLVFEGIILLA